MLPLYTISYSSYSSMSQEWSNSTQPFNVWATGHPLSKTANARSAASRLPCGTLSS
jgi:hypothetical protein